MSDLELIDAVALKTGEDAREFRRRGYVMLVDLPETGTVDWDSLGFGCREPFFTSTLKARKKSRTKTSVKKLAVRAA
jgi:hypothetical protein